MTVQQDTVTEPKSIETKNMTADAVKQNHKFSDAEEKEINIDVVLTALDILKNKKDEAISKDDYETAGKIHKKMTQLEQQLGVSYAEILQNPLIKEEIIKNSRAYPGKPSAGDNAVTDSASTEVGAATASGTTGKKPTATEVARKKMAARESRLNGLSEDKLQYNKEDLMKNQDFLTQIQSKNNSGVSTGGGSAEEWKQSGWFAVANPFRTYRVLREAGFSKTISFLLLLFVYGLVIVVEVLLLRIGFLFVDVETLAQMRYDVGMPPEEGAPAVTDLGGTPGHGHGQEL